MRCSRSAEKLAGLFNVKTGFVDWGPKTGLLRIEDFDPIEIGFAAGQLLAGSRSPPLDE